MTGTYGSDGTFIQRPKIFAEGPVLKLENPIDLTKLNELEIIKIRKCSCYYKKKLKILLSVISISSGTPQNKSVSEFCSAYSYSL